MPITQERFVDALEGAEALTQLVFGLQRLCRAEPRLISDANAVLEHSADTIACDVIRDLLGKIEAIAALINDNNEVTNEMASKVQAELRYFARVRKTNERAKYNQRKRRGYAPAAPNPSIPPKAASNGEQAQEPAEPTAQAAAWKADIDGARNALEAEGRLKPKPVYKTRQERDAERQGAGAAGANGETNVLTMRSHSYDPSVLRTSVPPLAQLNVQGTARADEDVL